MFAKNGNTVDPKPSKFKVADNGDSLIQQYFDKAKLEEVRRIFKNYPRIGLKKADFKTEILSKFKIELSDEDFETLITRLDTKKNDHISWEEFVTYLVLELEFKGRDDNTFDIEDPIVEEPNIISSRHRMTITHITFSPSVLLNGSIDYDDGKYVSMSKDGCVNFWSLDLKFLRSYRDRPLVPSVRGTWVTHFVCLSDVNILATSSTEREIRFYDTTSKRFKLIIVFESLPYMVCNMGYYFSENPKEESILLFGDIVGNMTVMYINKENRGPFSQEIGVDTLVLKWEQVTRGVLKGMRVYSIERVHAGGIKQVSYYKLLGSIVSCSTSQTALFVGDIHGSKSKYTFFLKRGIETFCLNEASPLIVTGSIDCILRLWNPFITEKPISSLRGHQASIVKIFFQDEGRRIFSLDRDRQLKVWETSSHSCIQTYSGFAFESEPTKEFGAYYNERNHVFIVGSHTIASVICGKLVDEIRSDGKTHSGPVSIVLFNRLFKCVITCGMDSNIGIWDLFSNKNKLCIRNAHFYVSMGVNMPLPITAATLDPPHQFLLTGSSDGSIKMWDFNTGMCLRNIDIGKNQKVTRLIWLKNRILAVGWNCRVVEFTDSLSGKVTLGKSWEWRHTNDILAADFRPGQALATGTYNGDLIFWRLETAQSYKRYNVTYPTGLLKLEYIKEKIEKRGEYGGSASSKTSKNSSRLKSEKGQNEPDLKKVASGFQKPVRNLLADKVNPSVERNLAIHCLIFLKKREALPDQATLMTATENGMIQAWSHHLSGKYITAFRAVHIEKDYVSAMTTDPENEFLFTGTVAGYIKIWLMKNYCLTADAEVNICMPLYRLQFPFLIKDLIRTRAKSALQYQKLPILLSSYKGHLSKVMSLEYVPECKILLSGSADKTARVWTLSGRYIGCLGQRKPWLTLTWGEDPEKTNDATSFRIPPDLVRSGSYTTLKVFKGAPPIPKQKYVGEVDFSISEEERKYGVYGKKLDFPPLGKNHSFPPKINRKMKLPPVDESMLKIPVFTHLFIAPWKSFERSPTPECVQEARANKHVASRHVESDTVIYV